MMNKKGAGVFQTILNSALVVALLYGTFIIIFGVGGGFSTAFNLGKFVAKVPVWIWLGLAILWLVSQTRK